jgi:type IV pilus assembly protein PilM
MNGLLTAAPKNLVPRYIGIMKAAGLELVSLETESFAIERSLVGNDSAPVLIVDIGAIATDITVILDKVPILNRSIDVGGNTLTQAIQKSLGVNSSRAEQFKRDFGLLKPEEQTSSVGIPASLEFVLHSILNEIRYIINLYQTHDPRPMEKIILSGGTAYVPGLTDYLSQQLNMKVFVGDPWARVVYPVDLKPVLQEIGPRFSIAVGLAMREITS